jgi:predicted DNA-binding transcriptional regulator YafY
VVSPRRVIYYRGNWYLDGWCHEKRAMRRFAIDAVRVVSVLEEPAVEAPASEQPGYGIFSGPAEHTAVLLFDSVAARWVAGEEWHPQQRASALPDGGLRLEIPYSDPQEILMDILRHGPHVDVVSPTSLRDSVAEQHRKAAAKYSRPKRSVRTAGASTTPRIAQAR